ncbi:unannotated protein [freshwater metagenome]|uniref:Unannotated protein n=1 Tax=freshwater metagenome TaxID=449393 RepID=A0A6J7BGV4_9ZZZZ
MLKTSSGVNEKLVELVDLAGFGSSTLAPSGGMGELAVVSAKPISKDVIGASDAGEEYVPTIFTPSMLSAKLLMVPGRFGAMAI